MPAAAVFHQLIDAYLRAASKQAFLKKVINGHGLVSLAAVINEECTSAMNLM